MSFELDDVQKNFLENVEAEIDKRRAAEAVERLDRDPRISKEGPVNWDDARGIQEMLDKCILQMRDRVACKPDVYVVVGMDKAMTKDQWGIGTTKLTKPQPKNK